MKRKIYIISTVCITLALLILLQNLLMPKYIEDNPEGALIGEYYKENKNHNLLFVGDCEVYESFSPKVLLDEYDIKSYIRGSANQLIWQSYYLLEEMLKYEKPKAVVYNVLAMKYDRPQKESYNRMTLDGMRWSSSKVAAIKASMLPDEKFITYVFPLLRFHSRWSELQEQDFKYIFSKPKVSESGYLVNKGVRPVDKVPKGRHLADYNLPDISYYYLDKMMKLCKENRVELILMKAPVLYPYWYRQWDVQIKNYAKKNGLRYINFLEISDEVGIDYSKDTYDGGLHLNVYGAGKMSRYLGKMLREKFPVFIE